MEPLQENFEYINCSDYIDWTTLTTLASNCLKSGKSIIDGISFSRCKENMLQVNTYDIDIEAFKTAIASVDLTEDCLLYTSPSPRDRTRSRMPSSA